MINYEKAREIAIEAHEGQRRVYEDAPYVVHPIRVAERIDPDDVEARVAAVLHDVIEDTEWTEDDLRRRGVSEVALEAVVIVSRRKDPATGKNEIYMSEFIERIATAPGEAGRVARIVKLGDVDDHLEHIENLPPEKRDIEKRYLRARKRIVKAIAELDS